MYLARRIPLARALELTLTGDPITAAEALAEVREVHAEGRRMVFTADQ